MSTDNITDTFKNIIKNNTPEMSIKKISNTINPNNKNKAKIGLDKALEIYNYLSDNSVKYDVDKYKNDFNKYKNNVNDNINKASKYVKNNKIK